MYEGRVHVACHDYEQIAVSQDLGHLGLVLQPLLQGLEMLGGVVFVLHLSQHSLLLVLQKRIPGVDSDFFHYRPLGKLDKWTPPLHPRLGWVELWKFVGPAPLPKSSLGVPDSTQLDDGKIEDDEEACSPPKICTGGVAFSV